MAVFNGKDCFVKYLDVESIFLFSLADPPYLNKFIRHTRLSPIRSGVINMIIRTLILLLVILMQCLPAQAERGINIKPNSQTRTALVIGNSAYKSSPLKNPANDAFDMAAALRDSGFDVILKTNASQRSMEKAIKRFGKKLQSGGIGLFYFAGHGLQVEGRNYLLPVDADIESESDVKYDAVDAGRVLGKMEDAGNDLNIVILGYIRVSQP